jgi:hypothetical protein
MPVLTQTKSPLLVFGLQNGLAAEEIRQLRTRQGARRCQNPNLLLTRPVAPRALRRHDWTSTRLLQPPRERLLAQTGFQGQLPRTDRILPVKRVTIFCRKARENGFVTASSPSRPAD